MTMRFVLEVALRTIFTLASIASEPELVSQNVSIGSGVTRFRASAREGANGFATQFICQHHVLSSENKEQNIPSSWIKVRGNKLGNRVVCYLCKNKLVCLILDSLYKSWMTVSETRGANATGKVEKTRTLGVIQICS